MYAMARALLKKGNILLPILFHPKIKETDKC